MRCFAGKYLHWEVLDQCGGDFSRENVMKQATNKRTSNYRFLPGIKVITSPTAPTDYHTVRALQLARWNGKSWIRFGDILEGTAT